MENFVGNDFRGKFAIALFPYDLQRSAAAIGLLHGCPFVPGVWGDLRHTVWMIGKVESSSTFPTITKLPMKTFFKWKRVSEMICGLSATQYRSP